MEEKIIRHRNNSIITAIFCHCGGCGSNAIGWQEYKIESVRPISKYYIKRKLKNYGK